MRHVADPKALVAQPNWTFSGKLSIVQMHLGGWN